LETALHRYFRVRALLAPVQKWRFGRSLRRITKNKNFCYVSANCIGGRFYQLEGRIYSSPTVGLRLEGMNYIRFCENLEAYLAAPLEQDEAASSAKGFPVGRLGDVEIQFVHYFTFAGAKRAWLKRAARIERDKIVLICEAREGPQLEEIVSRFVALPFPRKLLFTDSKAIAQDRKEVVYIPEFGRRDFGLDLYGEFEVFAEASVLSKIASALA
jgi:uncharacterized protein (DUF1919 family)